MRIGQRMQGNIAFGIGWESLGAAIVIGDETRRRRKENGDHTTSSKPLYDILGGDLLTKICVPHWIVFGAHSIRNPGNCRLRRREQ